MVIAIINCVSQKQSKACQAKDMYTSISFKAKQKFVNKHYDDYYIFSLKYGIIKPTDIIEPYNISLGLNNRNKPSDKANIDELTKICNEQLNNISGEIDWHVPKNYYNIIKPEGKHIKQGNNQSLTCDRYTRALNVETIEEAYNIFNEPKPSNPEPEQWWEHEQHGEYYGRSYDLVNHFKSQNIDLANCRNVGMKNIKSCQGWKLKPKSNKFFNYGN